MNKDPTVIKPIHVQTPCVLDSVLCKPHFKVLVSLIWGSYDLVASEPENHIVSLWIHKKFNNENWECHSVGNDDGSHALMFEYLVPSWWNCLEGLGVVALLEKVCH